MNKLPAIHICLIHPADYLYADALLDPARYFYYQFSRLSSNTSFEKNVLRRDAVNFIFGAHNGFDPGLLRDHCCILVNLEQLADNGADVGDYYRKLLRHTIVVDYDRRNPPFYSNYPEEVPIVSFGYAPYMSPRSDRAVPLQERPIDLLFIGILNDRRLDLIRRIESSGIRVHAMQQIAYGSARDNVLRQSKALLNLHSYDCSRFEQVRAFVSLSNGTPVLSELRPDTEAGPVFDACVTWFDEQQMLPLFSQDFGTPLFYQVMEQQLELFRGVDTLPEYSALLDFAAGVWKAHRPRMVLSEKITRIGRGFPSPLKSLSSGTLEVSTFSVEGNVKELAPVFQIIEDSDWHVEQFIHHEKYDHGLLEIIVAVTQHHRQPGIAGHARYYPSFDRLLKRMAESLPRMEKLCSPGEELESRGKGNDLSTDQVPGNRPNEQGCTPAQEATSLLVATDLCEEGSMLRLMQSLVEKTPNPVLYLTDLFGSYAKSAEAVQKLRVQFPGVSLVISRSSNLWDKAEELAALCHRLEPSKIWLCHHPQDAVAVLGALPCRSARRFWVHHAPGGPCLGASLAELEHVDLDAETQRACSRNLNRDCSLLSESV